VGGWVGRSEGRLIWEEEMDVPYSLAMSLEGKKASGCASMSYICVGSAWIVEGVSARGGLKRKQCSRSSEATAKLGYAAVWLALLAYPDVCLPDH